MKLCSFGVALSLVLSIAAGCGPAPGYGADGRRLVGPEYGGRRGYGQPTPPGYVGPQGQQPPSNVPAGYGPQQYGAQPGYQPYGQPAPGQQAANPPATTSGAQPQGNGVVMAPPYQTGQGAQPIAPAPNTSAPPPPTSTPAPTSAACVNTCRFANNGECDDGRPNSDTDMCDSGTDCGDCGPG